MPAEPIDREQLVARHRVELTAPIPENVLTVGNGDFAYSMDITGMQTFTAFHDAGAAMARAREAAAAAPDARAAMFSTPATVNTATMSNWGWHEMPNPEGYKLEDSMTEYQTARGPVSYPDRYPVTAMMGTVPDEFKPGAWLAENPQRLDLGRVGLLLREHVGAEIESDPLRLEAVSQRLDPWTGVVTSQFSYLGEPVSVVTVADPDSDSVAFRITSPLLRDGRLTVGMKFAYANGSFFDPCNWNAPRAHSSVISTTNGSRATVRRTLDATEYVVDVHFSSGAIHTVARHHFELATDQESLELTVQFAPSTKALARVGSVADVRSRAAASWLNFWTSGAAIDFGMTEDPRAAELERRVILSQYLTKVNCSGTLPPQETGLVTNSWQGKFHLEMHFWHAAHFATWGRPELLERSLPWYRSVLESAKETARRQSYPGARWPKQVGPEGRESPSEIGPLLIWQQPHILYLLELVWNASSDSHRRELAANYAEVVHATAEFMAAFAAERDGEFHLGAPVIPAQEFYDARRTEDPTFELAYWWWGLEIAQFWRERAGQSRLSEWSHVQDKLAHPHVTDGRYDAIATEPYLKRDDHPSLLAAFGVVPPTPLIDPEAMAATLADVSGNWAWNSAWGWDFPVMAMTAARLGDAALAVDALTREALKNRITAVGHSPQIGSMLPIYLPSNGSLLAAISLMATSGPNGTPLFPDDWIVAAEGFTGWPDVGRK